MIQYTVIPSSLRHQPGRQCLTESPHRLAAEKAHRLAAEKAQAQGRSEGLRERKLRPWRAGACGAGAARVGAGPLRAGAMRRATRGEPLGAGASQVQDAMGPVLRSRRWAGHAASGHCSEEACQRATGAAPLRLATCRWPPAGFTVELAPPGAASSIFKRCSWGGRSCQCAGGPRTRHRRSRASARGPRGQRKRSRCLCTAFSHVVAHTRQTSATLPDAAS